MTITIAVGLVILPLLGCTIYATTDGFMWENFGLFVLVTTGWVPGVFALEAKSRMAVLCLSLLFLVANLTCQKIAWRRRSFVLAWVSLAVIVLSWIGAVIQFAMAFHPA